MRKNHINDIWFISDTHFSDPDMIARDRNGHRLRDFDTVEEMDEFIVKRWNSVVSRGDKVYHLGDVGHGKNRQSLDRLGSLLKRLNGSKRLIMGNHDERDVKFYRGHFTKVLSYRLFTERGREALVCTHIPLHPGCLGGKYKGGTLNVHGHMHAGDLHDSRYLNVCAERVAYTPMHYDWLMEKVRNLREAA